MDHFMEGSSYCVLRESQCMVWGVMFVFIGFLFCFSCGGRCVFLGVDTEKEMLILWTRQHTYFKPR